uniref:Uncharacterized protein n=1 Tax=Heterorhabditis bacteriophora TaxID=37862 RepID=A0A1I7X4D1_HETBA
MDNFLNNFAAFNAEVERDQFALEEARRNNEILRNEISEMKVEIARHQNEETETKKKIDMTAFHSNEIGQTVTKILSDLKTLASKVEEIEKESIRQKKMEPEVRSKLADIRQKISNIELIDKDLHEEIKNISQIKQIKPEILSDMKSRKSHIFKELSSSADAFDLTELVSEIITIDEKRRTKFQLQQENIEQFDTISRIDKINESFREKLDVISDRRVRIQREKDEVIALNAHLLSRLKEAKDISSTLKSQLQALEVRLLEIQSSNSAKEKRIAELTEMCDLKRNILIERQQRLSDLRVQLLQEKESLERMRSDMESEKQRIKDDHELRMREIQSRKDEYSKTVHEADCEMAKFEALRIEGDAKKQAAEKDLAEKQASIYLLFHPYKVTEEDHIFIRKNSEYDKKKRIV